jgi:hypothetical protein
MSAPDHRHLALLFDIDGIMKISVVLTPLMVIGGVCLEISAKRLTAGNIGYYS